MGLLTRASTTDRNAAAWGLPQFSRLRKWICPLRRCEYIAFAAPRRAFTLVELAIVLLVMGILVAVIVPKVSSSLCHESVDAAAKKIAADLELSRRAAKLTGASLSVQFDVANNRYTLLNVKDINHPVIQQVTQLLNTGYATTLVSAAFNGTSQLTFDLYGQPFAGSPLTPLTTGSVVIQAGTVQHTIVVNPTTGKAQIQ
jgi:prepilin-type N-terminal cleavage/methylation domain-containing protein